MRIITSSLLSCLLLLTQPVQGHQERGGEKESRTRALARGSENRHLKGTSGKGSLKASKIATDIQFDAAIAKAALKCSALQQKIIELNKLLDIANAAVLIFETAVTAQATSVSQVDFPLPLPADASDVAEQADLFLLACRDLEADVNAYKKAVYDAAKIEAKIESSTTELNELADNVDDFIQDVLDENPTFTGTLPTQCIAK